MNAFCSLGFSIIALTPNKSLWSGARSISGCLLVLFLVSAAPLAMSQEAGGDSLKSVWHNTKLPDTTRMNALLEWGSNQASWSSTDTLQLYMQKGEQLALRRKHPVYRAKFLLLQGVLMLKSGDLDNALSRLNRGRLLADSLQNDSLKNRIKLNIGTVYFHKGDFSTAIDHYLSILRWSEKEGHIDLQARANGNAGMCYSRMEEYDKAISYYQKALKVMQMQSDTSAMISFHNNIALAYLGKNDPPSALESLVYALQLSKASGSAWHQAFIYMNTGEAYEDLNETELAIQNYQTSLQMHRANNNLLGEAQALDVLANIYRRFKPDSTLILGRQALDIAQQLDLKELVIDISGTLYQTYEDIGQYQSALDMHKLHWYTRDSIFNLENQIAIARSEAQYEFEKKQLKERITFEQELTQTRLSAQRRFFILLWVIAIIIGGGALYMYIRNVKYQAERADALLKISRLRESVAKQSLTISGVREKPMLDKEKIEAAIASKLGDTSWNILQLLAENPTISNREIAESLFLSEEGVSSSLRRMYSALDIQSGNSKNHKIALLTKAVELSMED
jgi:tetratricopeptide (TPR) repeat protein